MSDEMLALLWTIGLFLLMPAWIPILELFKHLFSRRFPLEMTNGGSNGKIRQGT
jgi:hypothetical protein